MTVWKEAGWDTNLKERLGNEVYSFLNKDAKIISYLSDWLYIKGLVNQAKSYQLEDNAMFVLHICKAFEGTLYLIARELGLFRAFNEEPDSIRAFYLQQRKNIENMIDISSSQNAQKIKDKLFSTIEDFTDRHHAVHYGSMLTIGEIENYDAIITKIKDVIKILMENGLIKS